MTTTFNWQQWGTPGTKRVAPLLEITTTKGKQNIKTPLSNVLVGLLWRVEATDGEHTVFDSGEVKLDLPTNPATFKDLEAVTIEDMEQWADAKLDRQAIEARLAADLAAMATPATVLV